MATIFIDPTSKPGGNGSLFRPYNTWSQVTFQPGNSYVQRAGTSTTATINIVAEGTATAPIRIGSYGAGAAPAITGIINLNGAAHVTVAGMTIRNPGGAAIAIQAGAHHNSIYGNTLAQSMIGVWIGNGAGGDNAIVQNTVRDNAIIGIGVHEISNPDGHPTTIAGNTVTASGAHGIDITGNNFIVVANTVSRSGMTISGASGIHVFGGAEGAPNGYGIANTIVNNVTFDNRDAAGPDGNGIQLDQYTYGNIVIGNLATGNDGAGIMLFDSHGNTIAGNLADANQRDPGATHEVRGDFVLAGSLDLTQANFIAGNTALSTGGPAILVDALTADNANGFSGNVWQNAGGGAATMRGPDASWAGWLANDMTAGSGLPADAGTGVAVLRAPYAGALSYSFDSGATRMIDGISYALIGWTGSQLVVGGEAVV